MGADMKRTIGLALGAFLFGVVTVAAGVLLAFYIYFYLWLPSFIIPETTVETREVPIEETVVQNHSEELQPEIDYIKGLFDTLNESNTDLWDALAEVKLEILELEDRIEALEN